VKSYFHTLFVAAVLLGSLIIFNHQTSERVAPSANQPDPVHLELVAELCLNQITASIAPLQKQIQDPDKILVSGNLKHLEYLNSTEDQVRIRTQMLIHLELLPVLGIQSGRNLHQYCRDDDPPLSRV
jgi:hypothetical protein